MSGRPGPASQKVLGQILSKNRTTNLHQDFVLRRVLGMSCFHDIPKTHLKTKSYDHFSVVLTLCPTQIHRTPGIPS